MGDRGGGAGSEGRVASSESTGRAGGGGCVRGGRQGRVQHGGAVVGAEAPREAPELRLPRARLPRRRQHPHPMNDAQEASNPRAGRNLHEPREIEEARDATKISRPVPQLSG